MNSSKPTFVGKKSKIQISNVNEKSTLAGIQKANTKVMFRPAEYAISGNLNYN